MIYDLIHHITKYNLTEGQTPCEAPSFSPSRRTTSPLPTDCESAPYGLKLLRFAAILLLLMVVGVSEMWGQVDNGLYYIASRDYKANTTTTNFYLCPTEPDETWPYYYSSSSPYFTTTNTEMPFMTTYQCRNGENGYDSRKALWVVKESSTEGWYYIIHLTDGKYLTFNDAMGNESNAGRMRLHIQKTDDGDKALFKINYQSANGFYDIISKYAEDNVVNDPRKYLNITGASGKSGNIASLIATNARADGPKVNNKAINVGGLVGLWSSGCSGSNSDSNSRWFPERIQTAPTISDVSATNTITITDAIGLPDGYTIRYTTGDGNQDAPTATTGSVYSGPFEVEGNWTVRAVVVQHGVVLTEVAEKDVSPVIAAPTVTNNGDGTISLSTTTPGGKIYYTTNGDTPDNTKTLYSSAFSLGDATVIKAITYNSAETLSSEVTTYNVPPYVAPTISFDNATTKVTITSEGSVYYNTGDGSQADPTTSSTPYSAPFDVTSPTTVKAIATHLGYFTSEVASLDIIKVATPTITVNSGNSITITCSTADATIYYTTDGITDPDAGSTPYNGAFIVENGTTIKAIAIKENSINSAIESLTVLSPIEISYDAANNKVVIINAPAGSTIYYTTGTTEADTPAPSGSERIEYTYGNTGFDLPDEVDFIKAIAVKGSDMSPEAQLAIVIHASTAGADRPYLIQSVECTDFYMIPGDNNSLNTSSLGRPSMEWCFYYAGKSAGSADAGVDYDYYYIKNKKTNQYVYFLYSNNKTTLRLDPEETFNNANATGRNNYKYRLTYVDTTNPGYCIHPYTSGTAVNSLSKKGGNSTADNLELASATANSFARWNFILSTPVNKSAMSPQLKVWGSNDRKYYKIKRNKATDATAIYLVPRTKTVSYAIASVEANVSGPANSILWYFDVAYSDEWVTYYYVVNAATGEYLYFNGKATQSANDNAFETREELVAADNDRYLFAFAKTTTADRYYILPKALQDLVKNSYSLVFWDGTSALTSAADRAADGGKWYLTEADVTDLCPPRLTLDADGNVTLSSRTRGATIKYKVGSETDFNNNAIPQMTDGSKVVITTQTTLGGAETIWPVTVVYKPTVTLAEQSVVYNGQTQTPELSSVMIGTDDITNYCVVSTNDINAGDATAVITQKENNPYYEDPYYVVYGTAQFTIEKSPLTIYANGKMIEYGDALPELSFSTNGLATIDEVHVNLGCDANTSSVIGNYPIFFNDLTSSPGVKYTITRYDGGADASSNYKDVTLIPSSLVITGKSLGDGTQMAEGITAELTTDGEGITITAGTSTELDENDYGIAKTTEGLYDDFIWTITGKGYYTGSAQVARVKSEYTNRDNEFRAGYVASHDWAIPESSTIKAWIATYVDAALNVLRVKEVNYLPKDVPVILTATDDKSGGVLVSPKPDDVAELTDAQKDGNLFEVVEDANGLNVTTDDTYKYVFHKGELVLAFRGTTLPKGTIYIDSNKSGSSVPAGAPLLIVKEDEITGIIEINENQNTKPIDENWYSLDGRKLSGKPVLKGLYINKGRKIVVK